MTDVGVYIATSQRPKLLRRALKSINNQTLIPREVAIVVNNSQEYIDEYSLVINEFHSLNIITEFITEKLSPGKAKNIALNMLSTDFATGLDDDDYFANNRLALFSKCFNKTSKKLILFSNQIILKPGNTTRKIKRAQHVNFHSLVKKNLVGNQVYGYTKFLISVGYADLKVIDDYDFVVKLFAAGAKFQNEGGYTYFWDQSHVGKRVTDSYAKIFRKTYYQCSDEYVSMLGAAFVKFRYGYFDYPHSFVEMSDFSDIGFYKYAIPKIVRRRIKLLLSL